MNESDEIKYKTRNFSLFEIVTIGKLIFTKKSLVFFFVFVSKVLLDLLAKIQGIKA